MSKEGYLKELSYFILLIVVYRLKKLSDGTLAIKTEIKHKETSTESGNELIVDDGEINEQDGTKSSKNDGESNEKTGLENDGEDSDRWFLSQYSVGRESYYLR